MGIQDFQAELQKLRNKRMWISPNHPMPKPLINNNTISPDNVEEDEEKEE